MCMCMCMCCVGVESTPSTPSYIFGHLNEVYKVWLKPESFQSSFWLWADDDDDYDDDDCHHDVDNNEKDSNGNDVVNASIKLIAILVAYTLTHIWIYTKTFHIFSNTKQQQQQKRNETN